MRRIAEQIKSTIFGYVGDRQTNRLINSLYIIMHVLS
jgi:hypothetical protein